MGISIGVTHFLDAYFRRQFLAAGLQPTSIPLDPDTLLHCWLPRSLSIPNSHPHKPRLVLLHGFGPPAQWQWRRQVGPLSAHFDLLVPDLIFFGSTTTRAPHLFRTEAHQAEAVIKLLGHVGLQEGPVSVAGTSYGGFVAYHVARRLGAGRVERVVIASSDLLKAGPDDQALQKRAGVERVSDVMIPKDPEKMRTLMRLAMHRPPRFVPDFVLNDLIRNLYGDKVYEKMQLIEGVSLGKKEVFQLTPLPQEVLIVWGEHDQIFPLEKAFEMQRRLGPNARLEVIKNTSHLPQEEDPTRFNEILLNFLLPAPRSSM